jgi:hypothetical protein
MRRVYRGASRRIGCGYRYGIPRIGAPLMKQIEPFLPFLQSAFLITENLDFDWQKHGNHRTGAYKIFYRAPNFLRFNDEVQTWVCENLSAPVEHPTCEEVADWKLNAFSMGWDFGIPEHHVPITFTFANKQDAALFKMTWL